MLTLTVLTYSDHYTRTGTIEHPAVATIEEVHTQAYAYRNIFLHTLRVVENGVSRRYRKDEVTA